MAIRTQHEDVGGKHVLGCNFIPGQTTMTGHESHSNDPAKDLTVERLRSASHPLTEDPKP